MTTPGMDLTELQENWHKFGETDPLWAIVSMPDKEGNKWTLDEFFATGEKEMTTLLAYLESRQLKLPGGHALDFGCGIGRVTQPMCRYFEVCHGVDIAPSMIEMAKKYNRYGDKCRYYLNETDDLRLFSDKSIDFIYCVITFQNIAPRYSEKYIKEFLRILAPQGLLVFQIPSKPQNIRQKIKQILPQSVLKWFYKMKYHGKPVMEIHGIPQENVIQLLNEQRGTILDIREDKRAFNEWSSFQYCVTRK